MPLKWGILGAGKISNDFVSAVETLPVNEHKVVAVAARSQSNAEAFATKYGIPRAYEGYQKLVDDKEVEIVYIGTLHTHHYEHVLLCLEHGKHVLCEKPFTINEKQTRKLVEVARKKKLFLMEALWSRCFPAYREAKKLMDSGAIGDVLFVSVNFGQAQIGLERFQSVDLGGSTILEMGIYILQFQQFVFRGLKPIKIAVNGHLNEGNTDETAAAIITYPEGKTAVLSVSSRVDLPNEGLIVGTKGSLKLPEFWCPTSVVTPTETLEFPLPHTHAKFNYVNSVGLRYEADEVRKAIKAGKLECPLMTLDETIELARLMDLLRKEVGTVFPQDYQDLD